MIVYLSDRQNRLMANAMLLAAEKDYEHCVKRGKGSGDTKEDSAPLIGIPPE